jgi:STE24 endopeptidase
LRKKEDLTPQFKELGIKYEKETLDKTTAYNLEKKGLSVVKSYYDLFVMFVQLYFWYYGEVYNFFYYETESSFWALIGFVMTSILVETFIQLPFSYYSVFVIEENFGFNKMNLKTFLMDTLKQVMVSAIMSIIFFLLLDWILVNLKDYFIVGAWVMIIVFNFVYIIIYPIFIIPLTYKLETLDENNEKEKQIISRLEGMCKELNFPLKKIYKIDGSTRSSHSQAFFIGVFKNKQVVLYDTLIDQLEVDEIMGVLCHEIGHWYHMHTYQMLSVALFETLVILYSFSYCIDYDKMYFDFGFDHKVYFMGFQLFMMQLTPILQLLAYLMNALIRRNEFQADRFAVRYGYSEPLKRGLVKISKENNVMLNPDPVYSYFNDSHPNILHRVKAINASMKQKND